MQICLKRLGLLGCAAAMIIAACAVAEDFLLPEKSGSAGVGSKRISSSSLKQEIAQLCAELLQQTSRQIERSAQIQQELYSRLSELMNSDKQAFLNNSSKPELQDYLKELRVIKDIADKQDAHLAKALRMVRNKHA